MAISELPIWAYVLVSGVLVQLLKFVLYGLVRRRLSLRDLVSANGLPSLHATVLGCLAAVIYEQLGVASTAYNATVIYSAIVLHDAVKVKRRIDRGNWMAWFVAESLGPASDSGLDWRARLSPLLADRSQRPLHVALGLAAGIGLGLLRPGLG